ncbi:hypothetical protein LCGC14_0632800 [marine sediment metagenome]|uniref:Uncharacterized protein n=1 Tax=marine sediment metagenome TaxID=412755 RepID=A0A0F9R6S9_9ZZZZ
MEIKKRRLEDKPTFQFYLECLKCTQEIKGTSKKHVESNLDLHLKIKHSGTKKGRKENNE